MRCVHIGMKKTDRERFDAFTLQSSRAFRQYIFVEGEQYLTVGGDTFRDAQSPVTRHQGRGALHIEVVLLKPMFISDLDGIAETVGRNEARLRAFSFDECVRCESRAVNNKFDVARRCVRFRQDAACALKDCFFRCGRRCEEFVLMPRAVLF